MADIDRQVLPHTATLHDVLARLNEGVSGIVLIVDETGRMIGMFTDGDARRAVLSGEGLEIPVTRHMNRSFTSVPVEASTEERLKKLSEHIRHLPVLDEEGRPVEVVSWAQLWRLPLVEPSLGGNELKYVSECIRTNWISSQGEFVRRFEAEFARYHDVPEAVSVSSGTTALHLALVAMGIGPGDEVIVPDLTFGATANAVIHCGATPVMVDVTPGCWTIDTARIEANISERTRAIIPVHLYGVSAEMDEIQSLAGKHGLLVLEDAAESLGARYKGRLSGTFGEAAAFSFFANKTITTGEGGMILTRDCELAERLRLLRDHGMNKQRRYWHEEAGFNYRITNMQSAVGCAQLERLDKFLDHRQKLGAAYREGLAEVEELQFQECGPDRVSSYWLFSVLVSEERGVSRDRLMEMLKEEGIETRPLFYPLHEQPAYRNCPAGDCPVSVDVSRRGLSLPTSNHMGIEEVDRVCRTLRRVLSRGTLATK